MLRYGNRGLYSNERFKLTALHFPFCSQVASANSNSSAFSNSRCLSSASSSVTAATSSASAHTNCLIHSNKISSSPFKVLDAPGLVDDFYVDILDWGPASNLIAVGLEKTIYLWDSNNSTIAKLAELSDFS